MIVDVNYLLIILCGIASMILGSLWYGPLFGKAWVKEMGFTKNTMQDAQKKGMGKQYGLMFVGSLVTAYVLTHSLAFGNAYLNMSGPISGIMGAFYNWLGFIAPVTLSAVLFDGKSFKLWAINNGYNLVKLCVMGVILTSF